VHQQRPQSNRSEVHPALAVGWSEMIEQITICGRSLRRTFGECVARQGISDSQVWLLWACLQAPPQGLSQTQLATLLVLSDAQVSASVEQLRQKGFLEGRRLPPDRRRQLWQLTAAGRSTLEQSLSELNGWASEMDRRFGSDRRSRLGQLVGELTEVLADQSVGAKPKSPSATVPSGPHCSATEVPA